MRAEKIYELNHLTITEWDGTTDIVRIVRCDLFGDLVEIEYPDGKKQTASLAALAPQLDLTVDSICSRCSRFSGWKLQYRVTKLGLELFDPTDWGKSVVIFGTDGRDVYGRGHFWAISPEERGVLAQYLNAHPHQ